MCSFCFAALECRVCSHKERALAKPAEHVPSCDCVANHPTKKSAGCPPKTQNDEKTDIDKEAERGLMLLHLEATLVDTFWIETFKIDKIGTKIYVHIIRYFRGWVHKFEKDHI